ncbi:hypothetical protein [Shimia sp.]|uniref:hypothetical protein n=1 Tax=Shimia sp. TaxID=1954381 RepID=UPI003562ABD3
MPRQNRVQPDGAFLAHPARGAFMGNRGILHDAEGRLGRARWRHRAWVCCLTEFGGRRRRVMAPGRYTELFFHDEAVALAAGHRPCGQCRRGAYRAFLDAAGHQGSIKDFDARLHAERALSGRFGQRRHQAEIATLPEGAFLLDRNTPALLWQGALHRFSPAGYGAPRPRPTGRVTVLTPQTTLRALTNGYAPRVRLPDPPSKEDAGPQPG